MKPVDPSATVEDGFNMAVNPNKQVKYSRKNDESTPFPIKMHQ
jgi:hypothetical protein